MRYPDLDSTWLGTTATTEADEETRAWLALDWLVRVHTPAWLRLAGLDEQARAIESLARIVNQDTATAAQPVLDRARKASEAARDEIWYLKRTGFRDEARAVWETVSEEAMESALLAVWDSVGIVVRDAASTLAWCPTWQAASATARFAASRITWQAAWDAVSAAGWNAAGGVARDAASAVLRPIVVELQRAATASRRGL